MSSSLCHGLQTCLEPRQVGPRVLRLKLTPHGPTADSDAAGKMKMGTTQLGTDAADWSFLHAFAYAEEKCEGEQGAVYVHPLLKCSASFLSDRSLEMCTESLGSETGSDVSDGEAPLLSPGGGADRRLVVRSARKKLSRSSSFPPPLTSVGGSTGSRCGPAGRVGGWWWRRWGCRPPTTSSKWSGATAISGFASWRRAMPLKLKLKKRRKTRKWSQRARSKKKRRRRRRL
ncbi:uncharacterized protein LOC104416545 [Eucalyptus grandis]|uniref:uncharacterized protein LOC104416545 n=1 Tax=Eucalyptus grandis TaxID=71139 RepID=UPI00192E8283|nr:uncharacterized protein LOC104416545 [Eucalyptus grandis]